MAANKTNVTGDLVTPILETMNQMIVPQPHKVTETTAAPETEANSAKKKATNGQQVKSTTTGPEQDRATRPVDPPPAPTNTDRAPGKSTDPTDSLIKMNDNLDTLAVSIKTLTNTMSTMSGELNILKRKQDFLEASWRDPDFEYSYDQSTGFFSGPEQDLDEGELSEPPTKKRKEDGGTQQDAGDIVSPSSSVSHGASDQPITLPENDATPSCGGNDADSELGLLKSMKNEFQNEEDIGAPIHPGLAKIVDGFLS